MERTEIEEKEYFAIYKKNKPLLCVHGSYTDVTGSGHEWSTGNPQWMTEWGLKDSDVPMIRAESQTVEGETTHKYFKFKISANECPHPEPERIEHRDGTEQCGRCWKYIED